MTKQRHLGGGLLALLLLTAISTDNGLGEAFGRYEDCDNPFRQPPDPDELVWLPYRTFCVGEQEMETNPDWWLIDDYPQEDLTDCPERGTVKRLAMPQGNCWWEVASPYGSEIFHELPFACNGNVDWPQEPYYVRGHIEAYRQDFFLVCPGYPTQTINLGIGTKYYVQEPVGPDEIIPEKNLGAPHCGISAGNPINIATGNKFHREKDAIYPGGREIVRFYNSGDLSPGAFGVGWRGRYSRRIDFITSKTPREASIRLVRDDGAVNFWRVRDAEVIPPPDASGELQVARENGAISGFLYRERGLSETFGADGRLLLLEHSSGDRLEFEYQEALLVRVIDTAGRKLEFDHDSDGRVAQIRSMSGSTWNYSYDSFGNLSMVTGPDGKTRTYHYENNTLPHALTGVTNELGNRIRSWAYDAQGRAVLSTLGTPESAVGRHEISYHPDGTTTTVDPKLGSVDHVFTVSHGVARFGNVSDICTACERDAASISYDSHGNPDTETDQRGNVTDFDYSEDNLLLSVTYAVGTPESHTVHYEWDTDLRQPSRIVQSDRETTVTYNQRGQTLSRTETDQLTGAARSWAHEYFEDPQQPELLGKKRLIDGPRTDVEDLTHFEYYAANDPGGRFRAGDLKAVINALGHRQEFLEYDPDGRLLRSADANGVETTLHYDPRGRKQSVTVGGQTTTFEWDFSGRLHRATLPDGASLAYGYDASERLTSITDATDNRIEYTLDSMGNRIEEIILDQDGILAGEIQRVYDSFNRLERLATAPESEIRFSYDSNGNRSTRSDALGFTTEYHYDPLDRLQRTIDPLAGATVRAYDRDNRLREAQDPLGNITRFEYDGLGNRIGKDSPDTGLTRWEFDDAGNPVAATDARGVRVEYRYDPLGRMVEINPSDDRQTVRFDYDAGPNGVGRLSGLSDSWGNVSYDYDEQGNLLSESRTIDGDYYRTEHSYDAAGRRIRTIYPSGMVIEFERDGSGRVTAIQHLDEGVVQPVVSEVSYRPFGPVSQFLYGNGLPFAAEYGPDGRIQRLSSGPLEWGLTHDAAGNLRSITDEAGGPGSQVFDYDELHRLISAEGPYGRQDFGYDSNGNRIRLTEDAIVEEYQYEPGGNRLAGRAGWTYAHDERGNREQALDPQGQATVYGYDELNRLSQLLRSDESGELMLAEYRYDGYGHRIAKQAGQQTVHFIRDTNGRLLGEYIGGTDGSAKEYVYLEGQPVAVISRSVVWETPVGAERILDNGDPGTTANGAWRSRSSNQAYGSEYLYAAKADRSYRWTTSPPGATYRVYARWVAKKSHSDSVHYTVGHGAGETDIVTRSHKTGGGQWQLLGTYAGGDGQDYVEVRSEAGKFVADAIRWEELLPPVRIEVEETHYIHFDHLGSPRRVSNAEEVVVWGWSSTPDGSGSPDADPDGDASLFELNLRFPGQYFDAESGLHHNGFRDYDPATARYLQSDPAELVDGMNPYRYARNSPLNLVDPMGLWVKRCSRKLGGPSEPPVRPDSHNPFRHDFLVVSGEIYSFQSGGDNWWDILLSQGRIDSNEVENELCTMVCDDDRFDAFVRDAVSAVGAPTYCVGAFPGTPEYKAGARNCQTWANEVIDIARRNYLEANRGGCSTCFDD